MMPHPENDLFHPSWFFQVEHECCWDWQRFTQAQLKVVAQNWHRDRAELLARALVTLEEARHAYQEEMEHHRDRQHQQDICSHLRDKVGGICHIGYSITMGEQATF